MISDLLYDSTSAHVNQTEPQWLRSWWGAWLVGGMVLTFYVGEAAAAFKQYAAYVQRRTATHVAQLATAFMDAARLSSPRRRTLR